MELTKELHVALLKRVSSRFDENNAVIERIFDTNIPVHQRLYLAQLTLAGLMGGLDTDDVEKAFANAEQALRAIINDAK